MDYDQWKVTPPEQAFCTRSEYEAAKRAYKRLDKAADLDDLPKELRLAILYAQYRLEEWIDNADADGIEMEESNGDGDD